jgi:hypothetical protein
VREFFYGMWLGALGVAGFLAPLYASGGYVVFP